MSDSWGDFVFPAVLGAVGGLGVSLAVWAIATKKLDAEFDRAAADLLSRGEVQLQQEIRTTLDREIPARVRTEIDAKFQQVGLNAQSGHQLAALLQLADSTGLIGLRGRWR